MPPPLLPLPPQQSRINLSDLKSQIVKKLGPERAQWYFDHLNRLLSQKLSKHEFNKLCISILGRENVILHNQLIRSVLGNAFHAKTPPPVTHDKSFAKSGNDSWSHLSNGETLPFSPCRSRSYKDRPSPLRSSGRADASAHQSLVPSSEIVVRQDGDLSSSVLKRTAQRHQSGSAERLTKRQRTEKPPPYDQLSFHSNSMVELAAVDDQEDVGRKDDFECIRGRPLQAPLGIPFCSASLGGARRSLPLNINGGTVGSVNSYDCGELCNSEDLRTRMEKIAQGHGLGGVTIDCANLLNYGLDAYLKQLIGSSVDLLRARTGREPPKQPMFKWQSQGKPINGVWQGNHMYIQNNVGPLEVAHKQENHFPISLQDFKVAMGLNPYQLGEDWPLLLEKICLHSFEE